MDSLGVHRWFWLLGVVGGFATTWDRFRYSPEYGTDTDHVFVDPKPHVIKADKPKDGKVTVYVTWQKAEE